MCGSARYTCHMQIGSLPQQKPLVTTGALQNLEPTNPWTS